MSPAGYMALGLFPGAASVVPSHTWSKHSVRPKIAESGPLEHQSRAPFSPATTSVGRAYVNSLFRCSQDLTVQLWGHPLCLPIPFHIMLAPPGDRQPHPPTHHELGLTTRPWRGTQQNLSRRGGWVLSLADGPTHRTSLPSDPPAKAGASANLPGPVETEARGLLALAAEPVPSPESTITGP